MPYIVAGGLFTGWDNMRCLIWLQVVCLQVETIWDALYGCRWFVYSLGQYGGCPMPFITSSVFLTG